MALLVEFYQSSKILIYLATFFWCQSQLAQQGIFFPIELKNQRLRFLPRGVMSIDRQKVATSVQQCLACLTVSFSPVFAHTIVLPILAGLLRSLENNLLSLQTYFECSKYLFGVHFVNLNNLKGPVLSVKHLIIEGILGKLHWLSLKFADFHHAVYLSH